MESSMSRPGATVLLRCVFGVLGCLMLGLIIYTICIHGLPFRIHLLTPWMAATLVNFYIGIFAIAVWVFYKVPNWLGAVLWIILLVCFGSIATCAFILMQLFEFSPQDSLQDTMFNVLMQQHSKSDTGRKRTIFSVMAARILFTALTFLMLGSLLYTILTDGYPFRKELLTPWMITTLVDCYINIVAISVWIVYKEAPLLSAIIWVVLSICFGSITTSAFIAIQLFQLPLQDPVDLVLLNSRNRLDQEKLNDLVYSRRGASSSRSRAGARAISNDDDLDEFDEDFEYEELPLYK